MKEKPMAICLALCGIEMNVVHLTKLVVIIDG